MCICICICTCICIGIGIFTRINLMCRSQLGLGSDYFDKTDLCRESLLGTLSTLKVPREQQGHLVDVGDDDCCVELLYELL